MEKSEANATHYNINRETILAGRKIYYHKNRARLLAYNREYKTLGRDLPRKIDTSLATIDLPKMYGDCDKMRDLNGGPCHVVGCEYHVFTILPVVFLGKIGRGEVDDDKILDRLFSNETCILRFVETEYGTLENIARIMQITYERVRQIEVAALRKLRHSTRRKELNEF